MSLTLRIVLLIASLATGVWILGKIRRNHVKQEDALFWISFAAILAILGIFPGISFVMARMLGIMSPSNFVFMMIIALLAEKLFSLSIQASTMESKLEVMAAELAIRSKDMADRLDAGCSDKDAVMDHNDAGKTLSDTGGSPR